MYWIYVLRHSDTKEIYFGKTNDIQRRIAEHNSGSQTATHRKSGAWKLIYAELYKAKQNADGRERKIKQHGSNKRWLLDRIKHSMLEG